jgi:hypothetical protein
MGFLRAYFDRLFVFIVFSILAFQALVVLPLQILSQEFLYGDGAYYFILVLSKQQVISVDWPRLFTHALVQLPLIFSIKLLGLTSIKSLSYIFGFSLYVLPLLSLYISTRILVDTEERYFIIPILLSYFYISINTSLFIISECHVALSVFWVLLSIILTIKDTLTITRRIVLILLSLLSLRLYESYVLLGPVLVVILFVELSSLSTKLSRIDRCIMVVCAMCFVASSIIALKFIVVPRDPQNLQNILSPFRSLEFLNNWTFIFSSCVLILTVICWSMAFFPNEFTTTTLLFSLCALSIAILCLTPMLPAYSGYFFSPTRHYDMRYLAMVVPGLVGLSMVCTIGHKDIYAHIGGNTRAGLVSLFIIILLCLWNAQSQIVAFNKWNYYKDKFISALYYNNGIIDYRNTCLRDLPYNWGWTLPTLSIILSGMYDMCNIHTIIISKDAKFRPFDIYNVCTLPDLVRYGIRYDYSSDQTMECNRVLSKSEQN